MKFLAAALFRKGCWNPLKTGCEIHFTVPKYLMGVQNLQYPLFEVQKNGCANTRVVSESTFWQAKPSRAFCLVSQVESSFTIL